MLPRLTLDQLTQKVDQSRYLADDIVAQSPDIKSKGKQQLLPTIPVPPRTSEKDLYLTESDDAIWYMVLSPREVRGVSGPFALEKLQAMYKSGEITNSTLFWREGEDDWKKLQYIKSLKRMIVQLPVLPPRIGSYNAERQVFDPLVEMPTLKGNKDAVMLGEYDLTKSCAFCGAIAVAHIPTEKSSLPDLYKCRVEIGSTNDAAEILPGFLFVGSQSSSKMRSLKRLGITLIINSTDNLVNPDPKPPFYRCRDAPLLEAPPELMLESKEEVQRLIELMDRVYDWIERHRLHPDLEIDSDPIPKEYRGPTDKYGRRIKTAADRQVFRRPDKEEHEKSVFPPRVLIWSRLGNNRSCVLAASYLIRQYQMSLDLTLKIIKKNRPEMMIPESYYAVLQEWSRKYSVGKLLCQDCLSSSSSDDVDESKETAVVDVHVDDVHDDDVERRSKVKKKNMSIIVDASEDNLKALSLKLNSIRARTDNNGKIIQADALKIKDIDQYLVQIPSQHSVIIDGISRYQWSGLFEIELSCRYLSDFIIATFIGYLSECNLLRGLRSLQLQSNLISNLAIKQLLFSFYPDGCTDDGDYRFDEFQLVTDVDNNFELMYLDLSNNRIDEFGTQYLCCFLKLCNTLTYLDISNNNLDDFCCTDIIHAISRPAEDFDSDDKPTAFGSISYGHSSAGEIMKVHNHSITDLNIGFNELGDSSAEALINMIKNNAVLRTLHLNLSTSISPLNYRKFANAFRLYNSTLQELSLADTPLTVKTMEYFSRIMQAKDTRISKLDFSNCNLRHQHLRALLKYVLHSTELSHLNLSGNKLSDTGAAILATIIEGGKHSSSHNHINSADYSVVMEGTIQNSIHNHHHHHLPPLMILDVSSCDFKSEGCKMIVLAISKRQVFKSLNLSNNYFGSDNIDGFDALSQCMIHDLRMNMCSIASHGASIFFQGLATSPPPSSSPPSSSSSSSHRLSQSLKICCLSGNEIADSAMTSFGLFLERNNVLEFMDLGFNLITNQSMEILKKCSAVLSTDNAEKKLYGLTVNFIGNKCDPFIIGPPGLARSKYNFNLGTRPNLLDPLNKGYSHIPSISRGNFFARKEMDNMYRASNPQLSTNSIE